MKTDSILISAGRNPFAHKGVVNVPPYRCSTLLFKNTAELEQEMTKGADARIYGRHGNPTVRAFEEAIAEIEGACKSFAFSSGLSAISHSLMAFLEPGDELLMVDSVYVPTRLFCDKFLTKMGIKTIYYDPLIGRDISSLMTNKTKVVFVESPCSQTFEMQDIPAIANEAHKKGAWVIMDNTWASPLYFNSLKHGVDVTIQAGTKYIIGHSDAMLGVASATEKAAAKMQETVFAFGETIGSEEAWLGLRGLRTLKIRLQQHQENALKVATWLEACPEVSKVLYPALASNEGHKIWQRDFTGASGLFSFVLKTDDKEKTADFINSLTHFGIGFSWGGYESLALAVGKPPRTATTWRYDGAVVRIHVGLDDPDDLIDDIKKGFEKLKD
ncbi:MAG: cystathionine beta-lyase [Alphaproteobacteria bacterium]